MFKNKGIKYKISVPLISVIVLLLLGMMLFVGLSFMNTLSNKMSDALKKKSDILCRITAMNALVPIYSYDFSTLEKQMEAIIHDKEVTYSYVLNAEENPITNFVNMENEYILQIKNDNPDIKIRELSTKLKDILPIIENRFEIKDEDELMGYVVLGVTKSLMLKDVRSVRNNLMTIVIPGVIIIIAFLTFLLLFLIKKFITKPIKEISAIYDGFTQALLAGKLSERLSPNEVEVDFRDVIEKSNAIVKSLVKHIEVVESPFMIIDKDYKVKYLNNAGRELTDSIDKDLSNEHCYNLFKTGHCQTEDCALKQAMESDSSITKNTDAHPNDLNLHVKYSGNPIKDAEGIIVGASEWIFDQTDIYNANQVQKQIKEYQEHETQSIATVLDAMSNGDFTQTYLPSESNKNTSESAAIYKMLSKSLASTREELAKLIEKINSNVESIASVSEQLSAQANNTSAGVEEMSIQLSTVASATEQASTNTNGLNATAQEVTQSVTSVASAIEEMSTSLSEVKNNTGYAEQVSKDASQEVHNANKKMKQLEKAADEIGKIVKAITDIADQTNMLALNATIEAASAGDAGKGFAVVANEVKELAKQTQEATEKISTQIEEMQLETTASVEAIKKVTKIINNLSEINSSISDSIVEQNSTTAEIAQNVGNIDQAFVSIGNNISETATGLNDISSNIQGVDQSSNDIAKDTENLSSIANELSQMNSTLKHLLSKFKF